MADVVAITAYAQFWFPGLSDWVASLAVILLLLGLNRPPSRCLAKWSSGSR